VHAEKCQILERIYIYESIKSLKKYLVRHIYLLPIDVDLIRLESRKTPITIMIIVKNPSPKRNHKPSKPYRNPYG